MFNLSAPKPKPKPRHVAPPMDGQQLAGKCFKKLNYKQTQKKSWKYKIQNK